MLKRILSERTLFVVLLSVAVISLSSCLTAQKLDKYIAKQYNNEVPKPNKKRKADIGISSSFSTDQDYISNTVHKTDKFLPLLVYWKYDHRQRCSLNPAIAVTNFSNAVNAAATKNLVDKLNGRKLELTVEQAPTDFSIVVKENLVWLVYAFSWEKVYIEPELKDLIVSYKVLGADNALKAGKITVKNTDKNRGLRFFQSWKSATSEYLSEYNANFTTTTKSFVNQLTDEL